MPTVVTELVRAPITFQAAPGTTVHSQVLEADVDGVHALFVLDTGSDVHLLTPETAERAGLAPTRARRARITPADRCLPGFRTRR